jgi:cell division protein FtsB
MSGSRARRWLLYGTVVAALAALSALDPGGLRKYVALAREVDKMRGENARLAAENVQLSREVHALRSDPAALERAVREELRYIRPGERVYVLDDAPDGRRP